MSEAPSGHDWPFDRRGIQSATVPSTGREGRNHDQGCYAPGTGRLRDLPLPDPLSGESVVHCPNNQLVKDQAAAG